MAKMKEIIKLERESVIPILKPKLVMRLSYLIGYTPFLSRVLAFDNAHGNLVASIKASESDYYYYYYFKVYRSMESMLYISVISP